MESKFKTYKEIHFDSADELWEACSPTKNFGIQRPHNLIYRGQGDANWKLIPSLLREVNKTCILTSLKLPSSEQMIISEVFLLNHFLNQCDKIGIKIHNDSREFRRKLVDLEGIDSCIIDPTKWPVDEALDLMAMAQHHGVPTRLLDWTSVSYTSLYFAASSALANYDKWELDSRIAIWVMDRAKINESSSVRIYKSAGSVSPHLAAQSGLFTIHPHTGLRGKSFDTLSLDELLDDSDGTVLYKATLSVFESLALFNLCISAGFSAGYIYPTADGAGRGVLDALNVFNAKRKWNKEKILLKWI
ncbi:FRG domain-containing protein [Atlantibacter hermannii]|uniref:FRG domain-containing protein n=1 Tax=Atlantibacter hermannii TaxID=565 RepID=UPI0028AE33F1|nr:FRG domain-containing protein [Atlantibacter hermannii]